MGVRGLTNFLDTSAPHLGRQIVLQNTRLVIDGNNLYYYLYEKVGQFERRRGGEYKEFYDKVVSFFGALKGKGVESFVVIDGAFDETDKKLETKKTRARDGIKLSKEIWDGKEDSLPRAPLMTKSVFIQALRDHHINFAVSDCEADNDIAALASKWKCPVLSDDADFLITAKFGWIRLSTLLPSEIPNSKKARVFKPRELAEHLDICEALLPLFASLTENDYLREEVLTPFEKELERKIQLSDGEKLKHPKFWRLAKRLKFSSPDVTVEHALSSLKLGEISKDLEQDVQYSLQEYTVKESNLLTYSPDGVVRSRLKTQNDLELDQEVLRMFRNGKLSSDCMSGLTAGKVFLGCQVEDQEKPSPNQCSLSLRQQVYFILSDEGRNVENIEEWDRKGSDYEKQDITPQAGPNYYKTQDTKLKFLEALDSKTDDMETLPEELICFAASLRYLSQKAEPQPESLHLIALICCFIKPETERLRSSPLPRFDKRAAQSFCQWQCVLRDAIQLNVVLHEPVKTPRIHETFNGPLAHKFLEKLKEGIKLRDLIPSEQFERSKKLYHAVTGCSLEEAHPSVRPNAASKKVPPARSLVTTNPFDVLGQDEDENVDEDEDVDEDVDED